MAEQDTRRPAASLGRTGGQRESSWSAGHRPIRLLDPFDIWFKPQVLLTGISRKLASPDQGRIRYGPPASWSPAVEIEYRDENLVITAELPGLSLEDIKVEIIGNRLVLQGERRHDYGAGAHMIGRTERRYGHFYREVVLPDGVDLEHVRAEFENGILHVTIPAATNRRVVPIQEHLHAAQ